MTPDSAAQPAATASPSPLSADDLALALRLAAATLREAPADADWSRPAGAVAWARAPALGHAPRHVVAGRPNAPSLRPGGAPTASPPASALRCPHPDSATARPPGARRERDDAPRVY
ncbi:hypothetical protein ACIPLC_31900 [Kitasatospora sp. NPDC086801]|uniref:hypothetical protein n=1 Tax=Kitasatospora sp. NPDC086801 TaxID=3364066 RepID=UPI0037F1F863